MHELFYAATLNVAHPLVTCPGATERLLQSMLLVNWGWSLFIRDLHELFRILTTAPAEFDYLLATCLLKSRAAYLVTSAPFVCPQEMIVIGLGAKRVQFAAIYYRLWVLVLAEVLAKEKGANKVGPRAERLFELTRREVERRYIEILESIALGQAMDEVIHGQTVEAWVTGTEMRDGQRASAIPAPVDVWVITQSFGRHRLVRPSVQEMLKKIKKGTPFHMFMERVGSVNRTDIAFEKVIRCVKVAGFHVLKYGDLEVQYYLTLTNTEKTTLYVVCADRTMRIHQRNGMLPWSLPVTIDVTEPAKNGEELYAVTFDNGVAGIFAIDFRPHKHNEHEHVPEELLRRPEGETALPVAGEAETDHGPQTVHRRLNAGDEGKMVDGSWSLGKTEREPAGGGSKKMVGPSTGLRADPSAELRAGRAKKQAGRPEAKVVGDFKAIILPSGRKMLLTRKHKRRAFLQAAQQWCSKHQVDTFFWQDIVEDYNEQFKDATQRRMRIMSDRIDDDLFKGQKAEFDELFEVLDRTAGHLRLKVTFLIAKKR